MLKRIIILFALLLAPVPALAQSSVLPFFYNSSGVKTAVGSSNPLPIVGSISASLSPFTPGLAGARGTPLTVTTLDSSGTLPTNTGSVIVSNVGSNPMYCNVNAIAATTSDQLITSGGGWFNFGIPSGVTTLRCIGTGGSTTANSVGGVGLGAGTGGGSSGGGGGGAVTVADGADVTQGALADAAATAGGTGTSAAKLRLMTTQLGTLNTSLGTINTTLGTPFQAGGSIGNTTFAVTQGTAANLNATVVGTGTFATQATLAAETTKVIGTVNLPATPTTNLANIDSATSRLTSSATNVNAGSALATTSLVVGSRYKATPPSFTDGQEGALQIDSAGRLIVNVGAGGAGGGAVYGPNAIGIAPTQPPVLLGGTSDGTAAGTINPWKVGTGGIGFINCSNCSGSGISVAFAGAIGTVGTPGGFKDGSGNFQPFLGDVTNGQWVFVKSSALPTGASTETTLAALNTKFPAQGQAVSAASVPVVLPAAQITTLTPPAAITGFATSTNQATLIALLPTALGAGGGLKIDGSGTALPISGTVTANAGTGNHAITAASGSVAAGAYSSGSFSSGAFASGSYASGAFATGSMVDLLTVIGTKNAGTAAASSILAGAVYNSTPLTLTNTQQASLQGDANGYLKVNVAAGGAGGGAITAASSSYASGAMSSGSYAAGALAAGAFATGAGVDGWDITQGAKADSVCATATGTCSVTALLKFLNTAAGLPLPAQATRTVNVGQVDLDFSRMSTAPIALSPLSTPVNAAFSTATTGGTLAAATYFYRVSAINATGETLASTETSQATTGTTSTVTVNWAAVTGATGYKVYGRTTAAELLIATVGAVTTYIDTGAVTPSGALPAANTTAGTTQIVALSGATLIYVTSFDVMASAATNVSFVSGTGTNCATGQAALTGTYPLTAQAGVAKGAGVGVVLKVPSGNALCVTNSGNIQIGGSVSYQQF